MDEKHDPSEVDEIYDRVESGPKKSARIDSQLRESRRSAREALLLPPIIDEQFLIDAAGEVLPAKGGTSLVFDRFPAVSLRQRKK